MGGTNGNFPLLEYSLALILSFDSQLVFPPYGKNCTDSKTSVTLGASSETERNYGNV